jgi:hypothetical protein
MNNDTLDLNFTHKYDNKTGVYYPKEYASYADFKERCLKGPHTTTLLKERIDFLIQYQNLSNNKSDDIYKDDSGKEILVDDIRLMMLQDDIDLNLLAIRGNGGNEIFKQVYNLIEMSIQQQIGILSNIVKDREVVKVE